MDPKKIRSFIEWEAPKNVDEVRTFMGLVGYYRRFIMKFSQVYYHVTYLHRKRKKFEWNKECATSFDQLNHLLTNALALKIADPDKEFVVCIDARKRGLGGVLMREEQVA